MFAASALSFLVAEEPDERISNLGLALSHPDINFFCVSFRQPGLLQAGVALMLSGATVIWYSLVWTLFDTQMRMRVHEELKSRGGYTEGAVEYLEKQVRPFLTFWTKSRAKLTDSKTFQTFSLIF